MALQERVGAERLHAAALDALDDYLASTLAAVGDRDASASAELFHDQPGRERDSSAVAHNEMISMLFLEDADHHS